MLRRRPYAFRARPDGSVEIRLGDDERELMLDLAGQFRSLLAADSRDDPDLRRLYPAAYPDDAERDADYAGLVHDDLLRGRLEAVDVVEATIGETHIDGKQLANWMTVVNGLRLVLGTRLDISEEDRFDPDADDAALQSLLGWLGLLLDEAVTAAEPTLLGDR
jgi:hypothetical protein